MNRVDIFTKRRFDLQGGLRRALQLAAAASAVVLLAMLLFTLGVRAAYAGRALPGVSAAGIEVSGLTQPEIELALGERLTYPHTGRVLLRDGSRQWVGKPAELGVMIDIPAMSRESLSFGRRGTLFTRLAEQYTAWFEGARIPTTVLFDQRIGQKYLLGIAAEINRPVEEARLQVTGLEVKAQPGAIGRQLDIEETLEGLAPYASKLHDATVDLVIHETPPKVLDASSEAAAATEILRQPLMLTAEGAGPWQFDPNRLAEILQFPRIETDAGWNYDVQLDPGALYATLEPLADELSRRPQNARFIFNDDTRELDLLEEAVIGRSLDIPGSILEINQQAKAGSHEIPLVFQYTEPDVGSDATAEQLGISEAVSVVSTYFSGSSAGRIQNIKTASSAFHGLLLAPGETLSMAEQLGDISLDNGYAEALIIFGDRTIKGVGGGVCQVSTTLFRAAFFGGYSIEERHPHAYRVTYYEQGPGSPGPGLDATVFVPLVDFKFTNDSENWLLLETYVYGTQLLWKFYSTSDGRSVQWTTSGPRNVVEAPEPLYKENPELEEGEIEQVDWEADGMDITVTRTVTRNGEIINEDIFRTHYLPWRAIYEYGPGTELPEGAQTEAQ